MITNTVQRSRTCKFFILALIQCLKLPPATRIGYENTICCKICSSNDRQQLSKNRGRGRNLSDYTIMATSRGSDHENTETRSQARFLEHTYFSLLKIILIDGSSIEILKLFTGFHQVNRVKIKVLTKLKILNTRGYSYNII